MKPYNERLPLIDAVIEATDGNIERIKDYRKTDTHINYMTKIGYFSVDSQWIFYGETVCTHEEFEQRARELGYKPKEQEMNNDWYEKGELPPVGSVVRHKESGKDVEVKCHLRTGQAIGERLCHPLIEIGFASDFEPLRTETNKLIEQMKRDLSGEWGVSLQRANAICSHLIKKGYRKIKLMSEDEFVNCTLKSFDIKRFEVSQLKLICELLRKLYRADCRFLDQGE